MFSRLEYVLTETFLSMRRHPMMAFAASTCIAATLFVTGIIGLALFNASSLVDTALDQVRFIVFFQPERTREETWLAYKNILKLDGVNASTKATVFRPKEKQWAKYQQEDPEYARLLEKNPLPDAVAVQALDVRDIPALKQAISQWPEVRSVRDEPKVNAFLQNVQHTVGKVSLAMAGILLLLSLVIVHHTIELTLYARRKEIHIMTLVGANPATVASPFLLEGLVYGVIGGGAAFGFLYFLYHVFTRMIKSEIGNNLAYVPDVFSRGLTAMLIAGIGLGLCGSAVSVIKYLRRPRSRVTNA